MDLKGTYKTIGSSSKAVLLKDEGQSSSESEASYLICVPAIPSPKVRTMMNNQVNKSRLPTLVIRIGLWNSM
jgi:hypothetical protein